VLTTDEVTGMLTRPWAPMSGDQGPQFCP